VQDVFFAWLHDAHPHLVPEYPTLYSSRSKLLRQYRQEIDSRIRPLFAKYGFPDPDKAIEDKFALNSRRGQLTEEATQLTLF
jgi:hypothetical protein